MQRPLLPITIIAALVAAGCVAAPAPEDAQTAGDADVAFAPLVPPIPDFDFSTVVDPDHANHQLPALHEGGPGLSLVGHTGLMDLVEPGVRPSITQVDVWENYAVVSGMDGGLAFAIIDISDPANPTPVSWYPSVASGWTARFSDDGQYVFYGCQILNSAPYFSASAVKGTCEDANAVHTPGEEAAGIVAVDVSDKANPTFAAFLPVGGSHNIFVTSIDGNDTIFTSAVAILQFDRETKTLAQIAEVPGVHDSTVAKHPVTGDLLLFTGTGELSIWNVNDPAMPEQVYDGAADENDTWVGWHEQTLIPGLVDGRAILALGGESFTSTGGIPDAVAFVDVTDPAKPTLLSTWKPPFESAIPWASYLYSVHEMAATPTGQVAVSWYHAGVWVLDVSTQERQAEPAVLAAYLPNEVLNVVPSAFAQTPLPYVPFVWGAGWDARGYLVVPDMHTGLYVLEPEWGLHPALDGGQ